jgi:hypothetical protein
LGHLREKVIVGRTWIPERHFSCLSVRIRWLTIRHPLQILEGGVAEIFGLFFFAHREDQRRTIFRRPWIALV